MMRDGLSFDDLGRQFSWVDLKSYIKYSRQDSALVYVQQNPPVDPATVPTQGTLLSIKEKRAAKIAKLQGADTEVVAHNRRDRKKQA